MSIVYFLGDCYEQQFCHAVLISLFSVVLTRHLYKMTETFMFEWFPHFILLQKLQPKKILLRDEVSFCRKLKINTWIFSSIRVLVVL